MLGGQGAVERDTDIAEAAEPGSGGDNAGLPALGGLRCLTRCLAHVDREDQLVAFDFAVDVHGRVPFEAPGHSGTAAASHAARRPVPGGERATGNARVVHAQGVGVAYPGMRTKEQRLVVKYVLGRYIVLTKKSHGSTNTEYELTPCHLVRFDG